MGGDMDRDRIKEEYEKHFNLYPKYPAILFAEHIAKIMRKEKLSKREPLRLHEIESEHDKNGCDQSNIGMRSFMDGVKFAEKAHGIG